LEIFHLDQLDTGLARYEEFTNEPPAPRVENAVTRAVRRNRPPSHVPDRAGGRLERQAAYSSVARKPCSTASALPMLPVLT
jgi:hypothetical protein